MARPGTFKKGNPHAYKKRHPKTGGRVAGTPNKKTEALMDICKRKGIDPFEGMLDMSQDMTLEPGIRLQAYQACAKYLYPTRRAIDMSGAIEADVKNSSSLADQVVEEMKCILETKFSERDES